MTALSDAALCAAARNWAVLPLHGVSAGRCTCGRGDCASPGKHPCTRRGLHDASADREQIIRWWLRWPIANIGIRTGATSGGLVVLDVDPDKGGLDSLRALVHEHGPLPPGPGVRTGSGGWHRYFVALAGVVIGNSAGRLGAGLDVRGEGGYVVAAGSIHASGREYSWEPGTSVRPLPELPRWLCRRLVPQPVVRAPRRIAPAGSPYGQAALDGELERVRTAPVGTRNDQLNRSSFALGRLVAASQLTAAVVSAALLEAAHAAGLGHREAISTIASGMRAGGVPPIEVGA